MTISGRKSVKKGQKMMKKARNLVYNAFFKKNCLGQFKIFEWLQYDEKILVSLHNFRTYFFPLIEINASFLNLLRTKKVIWHYPFACRSTQKIAHFMY